MSEFTLFTFACVITVLIFGLGAAHYYDQYRTLLEEVNMPKHRLVDALNDLLDELDESWDTAPSDSPNVKTAFDWAEYVVQEEMGKLRRKSNDNSWAYTENLIGLLNEITSTLVTQDFSTHNTDLLKQWRVRIYSSEDSLNTTSAEISHVLVERQSDEG